MQNQSKQMVHRGQLQIAETLIAVSLMLVLGLLLISAANKLNSSPTDFSYLDKMGLDILGTADETNLLRPTIYLFGKSSYLMEYNIHYDLLYDFFRSSITENLGYALIAHQIMNGTIESNYNVIIGTTSEITAQQYGGNGVVINYYLGSYSSAAYGQFFNQYLVKLFLWEKI